jgi:NitT/TauT family transport system ATP-binding protein
MKPSAADTVVRREPEVKLNAQLISVKDLRKEYRTRQGEIVRSIDSISFHVVEGEFLSIVGPSGCGKSTLLNVLAGLLGATEGTVLLRGEPVVAPRKEVGVVFQDAVLFPWRTVLQNVELPVEILGLDRASFRRRALELLDLVGLLGFEHRYPHELSGGMQQRVAIARALVHDPTVLLMDEPFGALDAITRESMNLELLRIWERAKKTVVFVTHSISEAVFLSDRVMVLSARPARIAESVLVDLPRPRTLELMATERFGRQVLALRRFMAVGGTIE